MPVDGYAFLSYVREDSDRVDRLVAELRRRGVRLWRDTDALTPGEDWTVAVRRAVTEASAFVACLSRHSVHKYVSYQREEITVAIEQVRRRSWTSSWFVPVLLDGGLPPDVPIGAGRTLRDLEAVDLSADWERGMDRLAAALPGGSAAGTPVGGAGELGPATRACVQRLLDDDEFPGRSEEMTEPGRGLLDLSRRVDRYVDAVHEVGTALVEAAGGPDLPDIVDALTGIRLACRRRDGDHPVVGAMRMLPFCVAVFCVAVGAVHAGDRAAVDALGGRTVREPGRGDELLLAGCCPWDAFGGRREIASLTLDRMARARSGQPDDLLAPVHNRRVGPISEWLRECLRPLAPGVPAERFDDVHALAEAMLVLLAEDEGPAPGHRSPWPVEFLAGSRSHRAGLYRSVSLPLLPSDGVVDAAERTTRAAASVLRRIGGHSSSRCRR